MDLRTSLPALLPKIIAWAQLVAADVAVRGIPLTAQGLTDAIAVGVRHPDRVRLLLVDRIPRPLDAELQAAALHTGLLGASTLGLTLGHAILIRQGHLTRRLLSHECRHVQQYEQFSTIGAFLAEYLGGIFETGYHDSPFERDARAHEISDKPPAHPYGV